MLLVLFELSCPFRFMFAGLSFSSVNLPFVTISCCSGQWAPNKTEPNDPLLLAVTSCVITSLWVWIARNDSPLTKYSKSDGMSLQSLGYKNYDYYLDGTVSGSSSFAHFDKACCHLVSCPSGKVRYWGPHSLASKKLNPANNREPLRHGSFPVNLWDACNHTWYLDCSTYL